MKKAIFTVLIGNYDTLLPAPNFPGWDTILITDQKLPDYLGWTVHKVESYTELGDQKLSRKCKILSHVYLKEYDLVCYIDANVSLIKPPPDEPTFFSHPQRRTVHQEAVAVIKLKKDTKITVQKQYATYKKQGFKDNVGLWCNRFFVRDQRNGDLNSVFKLWWMHVKEHSYRDQLSLPYVNALTKNRLPTKPYRIAEQYIKVHAHRPHTINIHYITPARSDKKYGLAINDIVKHLPDSDWICLRDIDTIPLNHAELIPQVEAIIREHGGTYDCFGAITNDLGLAYQLVQKKLNRTYNLEDHRIITDQLREQYGTEVEPNRQYHIGGFFMLFSKKIWNKVGGFVDEVYKDRHFFDYHFCKAIKKAGGKIGIAKGVYIYHYCRYGKERNDYTHLL